MIYLLKADIGPVPLVKIGYTRSESSLSQRIERLRTGCPVRMELLGVITEIVNEDVSGFRKVTIDDERELHRRFDSYRVNLEWFALTGSLREFVAMSIRKKKKKIKNLKYCKL